jgi:hypothetical protein
MDVITTDAPTSAAPTTRDGGDASASRNADEGPSTGALIGIIIGILGGGIVVIILVIGLAVIAVVLVLKLKKTAVLDEKRIDMSAEQDGVKGIELGAVS